MINTTARARRQVAMRCRPARRGRSRAAVSGACVALAITLIIPWSPSAAQGPRGAGPDARTPAAGSLRIGLAANWMRSAERYENGILTPLGSRYSFAALGTGAIGALAPVQSAARAASGSPDFLASLGSLATNARARFESTPIAAEFGITDRLAVGITVPFVTSISRVDAVVNGTTGNATVGFNPALRSATVLQANGQLLSQLDAAAAFLTQRIATCSATPGAPGCSSIVAAGGAAQALVAESAVYASAIASLYGGRAGSAGAAFVPLAGSPAQAAIAARLAGIKAQYASFGATQLVAPAPVGALAPITTTEFQGILADSAYGIRSSPLASVVRRGVGDIDVSAQYTWHDSYHESPAGASVREAFWWRSSVTGVYRLGTGAAASATELIPVARGDHQSDIELRSITDVGLGARYSLTAAFRFTLQNPADQVVRVPAFAGDAFPEAVRTITASADPGDEFAVELYPRVTLSEAMSVAAFYGYRRKGEDVWTGSGSAPGLSGAAVSFDASALGNFTGAREHRFGASIGYSTVASWRRGGARWPLEISLSHFQTTAGSGGYVPKLTRDEVQIRWYWRAFGAAWPDRRRPQ